jgi:protein TonB
MTALAVHGSHAAHFPSLSWPRIGAWSGSISLHLLLLAVLLIPPVALQVVRQIDRPFMMRFIEPEVIKPEPAMPTVERKHQEVVHIKRIVVPPVPTPPISTEHSNIEFTPPIDDAPPARDTRTVAPDSAPSAIAYGKQTRVPYPRESLINREHGTVILKVLVSAEGLVQAVEIEKSSGFLRLDRAARDAVKGWSFHPALRNGAALSGWALVPVTFDLQQL